MSKLELVTSEIAPEVQISQPIYPAGEKLVRATSSFTMTDVDTPLGHWVSERCQKAIGCSERGFLIQVRQYMDNGYLFLKSDEAVLLAQLIQRPFGQKPIVELVFMFAHDWVLEAEPAKEQILPLLQDTLRWMQMHGATEFRYEGPCDWPNTPRVKAGLLEQQRKSWVIGAEFL
jgi:hypothetical protein